MKKLAKPKKAPGKKRTRQISDGKIIMALMATKGGVYLAAAKVGCTYETVYKRIRESQSVANAFEAIRGVLLDTCERNLYQSAEDGNIEDSKWLLRHIGKDRGYTDKNEHAISGQLDHDHRINSADIVRNLLERPDYLEYQRLRALRSDQQPGDAGQDRDSGQVEDKPTSGDSRPQVD